MRKMERKSKQKARLLLIKKSLQCFHPALPPRFERAAFRLKEMAYHGAVTLCNMASQFAFLGNTV